MGCHFWHISMSQTSVRWEGIRLDSNQFPTRVNLTCLLNWIYRRGAWLLLNNRDWINQSSKIQNNERRLESEENFSQAEKFFFHDETHKIHTDIILRFLFYCGFYFSAVSWWFSGKVLDRFLFIVLVLRITTLASRLTTVLDWAFTYVQTEVA